MALLDAGLYITTFDHAHQWTLIPRVLY